MEWGWSWEYNSVFDVHKAVQRDVRAGSMECCKLWRKISDFHCPVVRGSRGELRLNESHSLWRPSDFLPTTRTSNASSTLYFPPSTSVPCNNYLFEASQDICFSTHQFLLSFSCQDADVRRVLGPAAFNTLYYWRAKDCMLDLRLCFQD